jgi:hypothetical protein
MSFREKGAWICLVSTLVVFVPYFSYVLGLSGRGELTVSAVAPVLVVAIFFQAVINAGAMIAVAVFSRADPKDERDRTIELRSFRNAYLVLAIALVSSIAAAMFAPASGGMPTTISSLSQLLLACFVAAESAKYLTQVVCYRRGY